MQIVSNQASNALRKEITWCGRTLARKSCRCCFDENRIL